MKTIVLQFASGDVYHNLLSSTYLWHSYLCRLHNYDYKIRTSPITKRSLYWEQTQMIREAILERYEHIIYFDPDVVWLGDPLPCPDTIFGMTWHDFEQGHYNNGACYINNKGFQAYWPVEEWWARPDEGHKWSGQHSMNLTLVDHPERVTRLDHKWNAVQRMPQYHSPNPSVLAWHGTYGDCLFEMAQTVEAAAKKQMLSLGNINPYTGTR